MSREHLSQEELSRLKAGSGSPEELDRWLAHIGTCDQCALQLSDMYREDDLLQVTPLFAESVLREIAATEETPFRRPAAPMSSMPSTPVPMAAQSGQRPGGLPARRAGAGVAAAKKKETTPRVFRCYPFKVGMAACMTILLLNAGVFGSHMDRLRSAGRWEERGEETRQTEILAWTARPFEEITKSLRSISQHFAQQED